MQTSDAERYLELLRADAERLATVAAGNLGRDVPPCPGWTVRDVVVHTGQVYLHKVANMRTGRAAEFPPGPEDDSDPVAWFRAALAELTDELVARGPDGPSYTWWPADQTAGFWYRRMAQETAVHRVDAESAVDAITAVDTWLAVDGVAEVLELFLAGDWSDEPVEKAGGETVLIRTGPDAWRVTLERDRVGCERGAGPAAATVTGEPGELLLWLWGRRPLSAVHVDGAAAAASALRERLAIATE